MCFGASLVSDVGGPDLYVQITTTATHKKRPDTKPLRILDKQRRTTNNDNKPNYAADAARPLVGGGGAAAHTTPDGQPRT